jgi:hypothetical protein
MSWRRPSISNLMVAEMSIKGQDPIWQEQLCSYQAAAPQFPYMYIADPDELTMYCLSLPSFLL